MKIVFFFLLICINTSAKTIQGRIYNITDNTPIANTSVRNLKTGQQSCSDNSGFFHIEGSETDTISFAHDDFSTSELTIRNILNSQNKVYLFPQLHQTLPEVTVTPIDMYTLYRKAVTNLKNRMVVNKAIPYRCIGTEKEVNLGDERSIAFEFTAALEKTNPKKVKLNYACSLANLQMVWDSPKSDVMKNERIKTYLFHVTIPNTIQPSDTNSIVITDSTILIYNRQPSRIYAYTISRSDTTLIQIAAELRSTRGKYTQFRTFKVENLHTSKEIVFKNSPNGYYLYSQILNNDFSVLMGKSEREERIILSYKIEVAPDLILNTTQAFKPITHHLYRMENKE